MIQRWPSDIGRRGVDLGGPPLLQPDPERRNMDVSERTFSLTLMIELAGTRYALGRRTALTTAVATSCATVAYLSYGVGAILLITGRREGLLMLDGFQMFFAWFAVFGFAVVMTVLYADKQPVREATLVRSRWQRVRSSEAVAFLTSPNVFLLPVASVAVVIVHFAGRAQIIVALLSAAVMAWHTTALSHLTRHMWRDASARVDGRTELYRGFDWTRMADSDEQRFRARFPGQMWKAPTLIIHSAEADRYSRQARNKRLAWMMSAGGVALLLVALVHQPLMDSVASMAHALTHLSEPARERSMGEAYLPGLLAGLVLFPVGMQYRASDLDALSKIYDDRATELRRTEQAALSRKAATQRGLTTYLKNQTAHAR